MPKTILNYLQDLDAKGYTVIPAQITIQDVLSLVDVQIPEAVEVDLSVLEAQAVIAECEEEPHPLDEPVSLGENVALAYMEPDPRTPEEKALDEFQAAALLTQQVTLSDMTPAQQTKWFYSLGEIPF